MSLRTTQSLYPHKLVKKFCAHSCWPRERVRGTYAKNCYTCKLIKNGQEQL